MLEVRKTLGLVPWPEKVEVFDGHFEIPAEPVILYSPAGKHMRFAAQSLAKALRAIGRRPLIQSAPRGKGFRIQVLSGAKEEKPTNVVAPKSSESYRLDITHDIDIRANSAAGAFYGVQTLAQAVSSGQGKLPRCSISDAPKIKLRGVMADLARLKEKDEYYFKLIDFMSQYKLNAIFLHLTDDQGAPIEMKSHPKLTSDYPLTHETIRRLIDYAAQRHIDVIPEVEVWGHAGWVTNHPEYKDISEEGPDLCTTNPKTWKFVSEIFDEICRLFPSKYIHGGSDEAKFGKCPKCLAEKEKHGDLHLVGEHVKRTAEIIHDLGRIPIIWADIILNYPGSEDIVPKYAILNHWDYKADLSDEPVTLLKSKGFEVMGGSGIVFGSRAVLPKGDALRNVENFGQITRKQKLVGINNTIWCPQRYVSDTLWYGIALAAEASWSGGKPDRKGLTALFFKSYFGIDASVDLVDAIYTLHEIPAYVGDEVIGVWRNKTQFDELATPERSAEKEAYLIAALGSLKTVRAYRSEAVRHKWEYSSLVYAGEMKKHIGERSSAPGRLVRAIDSARELTATGKAESAAKRLAAQSKSLARLAAQEKRMASETERFWDRWRYKDDPKKTAPFQNTLNAMKTSDGYLIALSERLAKASEQLAGGEKIDWDALLAE
jgi:hypothetical protein